MPTVELPTGETVEFPDNMPVEQMEAAVLQHMQGVGETPIDVPLPLPEGAQSANERLTRTTSEQFQRDLPALVGGIAGPLIASKIPAVAAAGPAVQRGAMVLGAGIMGALGEAQAVLKDIQDNRADAPKTNEEIASKVLYAGGEQAAFEGIGQLALKTGSFAFGKIAPKVTDLSKSLAKKFSTSGGEMTAPQLTDAWWIHQLEGLSRGSLTGSGVFKRRDIANQQAFKEMEDTLVKTITKRANGALSDTEIGNLFVNTVKGGRAAHSDAAGVMYSEIDDLVADEVVKFSTKGRGMVPAAKTQKVPKFFVNTESVKDIAKDALAQLERTSKVGAAEVDTTLLKRVSELNNNLSFKDAHFLRSNLLSMQRDLTGVVGAGRAKKLINELTGSLDKSIESTAVSAGGDVLQAFRKVDKFWKQGKETFDSKFISNLINADKTAPERIGETIFRTGSVKDILSAKKAIKAAAKMDKTLNTDLTWNSMQVGYLQGLLGKTANSEGQVSAARLMRAFTGDRKQARTLSKVFSKQQRDSIIEFANVGKKIQAKPEGGLGMVMNLAQAGVVLDLAQASVTGASALDPGQSASILIAPSVIARALTSPSLAKMMIKAQTTRVGTTLGKQLATKISAEIGKLQQDEQE